MEKKMENRMLHGSILTSIVLFAIPILLGTFIQQLYNTADSIIVGRYVNANALAAIGASGSLTFGFTFFYQGFTNGCAVVISQKYGAGKMDEMKRAISTSIWIGIFSGLFLTIGIVPITRWLLEVTSISADILDLGNLYFKIFMLGSLAMTLYNTGTAILRAVGDSKRPLYYLAAASILNVILDLLFVCVFEWGVKGAAVATIISQYVSAVLVMIRLMTMKNEYALHLNNMPFDKAIASHIIRIGIPAGIQNGVVAFACIMLQAKVNTFGVEATAGYTAGTRLTDFMYMPGGAFGMAATTFVGQNLGAGQYERIHECAKKTLILNTVSTIMLGVAMFAFADPLIALFTTDPLVASYAYEMVKFVAIPSFMYGILEILACVVIGTGESLKPMLITLLNLCVIRLCWIYGMTSFWHDIRLVFMGFPVSWVTGCSCMIYFYYKSDWFEKAIAKENYYHTN